MTPIIDRNALFGEFEIIGAQISPDGQYMAVLKPYLGVRNIWVKRIGEPFSDAKPVTAETRRPIPGYFWSRDARYVLYVQDNDGDENFNIYALDVAEVLAGKNPSAAARNMTAAVGARAIIYSVPRTDPDVIYIGLNDRDKAWFDLYHLRLSTGERTLLRKNTDRVSGWFFDHRGALRMAHRTTGAGDTEILRVDPDALTPIYRCNVFEECHCRAFDADDTNVYIMTNKDCNLISLALLDPDTGAVTPVESDTQQRVDLTAALFSEVSKQLLATIYIDDKPRLHCLDAAFETDYLWLRSQLPGMELSFTARSQDETLWTVFARSDTEPGGLYLFDRGLRKLQLQYRHRPEIPREALASMHCIRYKSLDGLEVPAYLTLPVGLDPTALPLMVFPHGGPWARDVWGYNPFVQFFANRGYAVLQPNFRGSTGYGKEYLNAGNGQWGRRMQDDLTAGVQHLADRGTVDPARVGIAGLSYGGYATLAGVAFTPHLYAAAASIVGPSNLLTFVESIPPYWESFRKRLYTRMADPNTADGRELLESASPLNAVESIRAPLLIAHGANDQRVRRRESDQIVIAVRNRGIAVQYLVATDEGHGFAHPLNNLAMVTAIEQFFAAHLGGRHQEGVPEDVAIRLKQITVDARSVELR
jgi:dipeptidyl aminopeptidase/acylaminoacyl peptidase